MKAIVNYGPFSTMIDVRGDRRPIYFPKPTDLGPFMANLEDDVVMENTTHKLEFSYRTSIDNNGDEIQIYRFERES